MLSSPLGRLLEDPSRPVIMMDAATRRIERVSPGAALMYGYGEHEWRRLRFDRLFLPKERPNFLRVMRELNDQRPYNLVKLGVWKHRTKDGRKLDADVVLSRFSRHGQDHLVAMIFNASAADYPGPVLSIYARRALLQRTDSLIEAERRRLALDIHDGLGQGLTAIRMKVAALLRTVEEHAGGDGRSRFAAQMRELELEVQRLLGDMRRIVKDLRPALLDDFGLIAAMENLVQDFSERTGIPVEFTTAGSSEVTDEDRRIAIYRICQEALTNVAKHAQATKAKVNLSTHAAYAMLVVSDNGCGVRHQHMARVNAIGLVGMRERAQALGGQLRVRGVPNRGTTIKLYIPLHDVTPAFKRRPANGVAVPSKPDPAKPERRTSVTSNK